MYGRRDLGEVRRDLAKWRGKYPKLTGSVEENIEETLTYFRLPLPHRKHMKSTDMLERLNEEIRRRTYVVRIFPSAESCLRLVRALTVERHKAWLEDHRYLDMDLLKEHKEALGLRPDRCSGPPKGWTPAILSAAVACQRLRSGVSKRRRLRGDGSAGPHD